MLINPSKMVGKNILGKVKQKNLGKLKHYKYKRALDT